MSKQQFAVMRFDPATCMPRPYPSHAEQYRDWHGVVAWLYNPWTGDMRDPRDIGSDTFGRLIVPPSERVIACAKDQP
jgi:hypothetical protein